MLARAGPLPHRRDALPFFLLFPGDIEADAEGAFSRREEPLQERVRRGRLPFSQQRRVRSLPAPLPSLPLLFLSRLHKMPLPGARPGPGRPSLLHCFSQAEIFPSLFSCLRGRRACVTPNSFSLLFSHAARGNEKCRPQMSKCLPLSPCSRTQIFPHFPSFRSAGSRKI